MKTIHKHHIVPKHEGGTDDPLNLIELTVEEHAEAHKKLYEEYGRWQDKLAWQGLVGMIGHDEVVRAAMSSAGESRRGSKNHMFGKTHSDETKRKISETQLKMSDETKSKISEAGKGRTLSESHKLNLSKAGKGRVVSEETRSKIGRAKSGQRHTVESKRKMAESQSNRSPETIRRMSEAQKGKSAGINHYMWIAQTHG